MNPIVNIPSDPSLFNLKSIMTEDEIATFANNPEEPLRLIASSALQQCWHPTTDFETRMIVGITTGFYIQTIYN